MRNKADLWNSGKGDLLRICLDSYQGKLLAAKSFAYWKVRIWNKDGEVSDGVLLLFRYWLIVPTGLEGAIYRYKQRGSSISFIEKNV